MALSKKMRIGAIVAGVLCLPCLTVFGVQCSISNRAQEGIRDELAAIRALGVITTPGEMPVPGDPALNAALLYSKAIAMRKELKLELPEKPTDPAKLPAFEAAIKKFLPVMKLVRQGSGLPECGFERKWELGPNLFFPEFVELKNFAKVGCELSEITARSGNFAESFAWLQVVRRLSVHSQEPHTIAQLVGLALEGILLKSLQAQIVAHGDNPDFRRRAASFLDQKVNIPNMRDGMSGEIILITQTCRMLDSGELKSIESLTAPVDETEKSEDSGSPFNYFFKVPAIRNQIQHHVLRRLRLAIQEMGPDGQDYERIALAAKAMDERNDNPDGLVATLAGIFAFEGTKLADASLQLLTRLNLTRQGLELYSIRAKTGSFPKSLDATKKWSRDLFSGQILIYRLDGKTFKLYSVGRNRQDDGGKLTTAGRKLDVVF